MNRRRCEGTVAYLQCCHESIVTKEREKKRKSSLELVGGPVLLVNRPLKRELN